MTAPHIADVEQLLAAIASYADEVARQRGRLRVAWQSDSADVERLEAQFRLADAAVIRREKAFHEFLETSRVRPDKAEATAYYRQLANTIIANWFVQNEDGSWALHPSVDQEMDANLASAIRAYTESLAKIFNGSLMSESAMRLARYSVRQSQLRNLRQALDGALGKARAKRSEAATEARATADLALAAARVRATKALGGLPAPLQPWSSPTWADWALQPARPGLDQVYAGVLIPFDDGDLGDNASFGSTERIPLHLTLRGNLEIVYDAASREQALTLARSLLLRQLALAGGTGMRFCFFDPMGLGQSVAGLLNLSEYNADLIGGKAWSSQTDLNARLTELTAHIEQVIQKYLRTTYETIDEFNAAAGEIAEPYRYLVLCDFPTEFTDETMRRVKSIMKNGPRCGVRTLLLTNKAVTPGYGVDPALIAGDTRQISFAGLFVRENHDYELRMRLEPEADSAASPASQSIIDTVGHRAASMSKAAVTFEKAFSQFSQLAERRLRTDLPSAAATTSIDDDSTWWRADSTGGLFAPIGQKGARDAAVLAFDSDHSGTLLVGRPGSGKSTLLHTLIGGLATLYSPRELELYLIDFKEGVEFKAYAEEALPHARMVAIESDREFGLSVLQSLEAELSRRGELLRATGGRQASLQSFREATGQTLPRVLLVFDEFQVMFARNDKVGLTAANLLENIIRQGRGYGVHVLLGSQSLAGLDALGAHVPQLLPTRILLPATEADVTRVLGDGNDEGQYLTTRGEGILNGAGGAVEANERFKGALLAEPDRIERVRRLRAKADAVGFTRRPTVFEGNASVPLDAIDPAAFRAELTRSGSAPVRLRAGVPMTAGSGGDMDLRREAGANVLAVVRDGDDDDGQPGRGPAYGLLTACVMAAAQSPARIDVIDFMPADDGLDAVFEPLLDRGRVRLRRRRAFAPLIEELRKEVRGRVEDDDTRGVARLAFLFGAHRARELDTEMGSLDADPELAEALEEVMRDGPEVGVHVWIWSDSVGGAQRRLSSRMIRECAWRVAGKMSTDDSLSLLGSERAAEIRTRQLILSNDDRGLLTRVLSFALPPADWLARVLDGPGKQGAADGGTDA